MENKATSHTRIYWLDAARVMGILSISLNHAVNRSYDNYRNQMEEFQRLSALSNLLKGVLTVFSHLGVPLFLMITGALLLNRRYENRRDVIRFYRHNFMGILITTEIWYVIMYCRITAGSLVKSVLSGSGITTWIWGLIKTMLFLDQVTFDSMWYMPMILCIYMLIPMVAMSLRKWSIKVFSIPLLVLFISSMLIPGCNLVFSIFGRMYQIDFAIHSSNLLSMFFLYVFAGYWVINDGLVQVKGRWIAVSALFFFFLCVCLQFFAYSREDNYVIGYDFPLILLVGVLLFELIKRQKPVNETITRIVTYISRIAFGIYFVHIMIMTAINKLPFFYLLSPGVKLVYLEVISFAASVFLIRLLSKVELFKNRLFMIK